MHKTKNAYLVKLDRTLSSSRKLKKKLSRWKQIKQTTEAKQKYTKMVNIMNKKITVISYCKEKKN